MRAGELRHLIKIERPVETQSPTSGEVVRSWEAWAAVYASKADLAGREYFAAQQMQSSVTTRFKIRWLAGLDSTMRIISDSIVYDIDAVLDPDGTRLELHIMAKRTNNSPGEGWPPNRSWVSDG
jgi:SPP1 family predicted phage head-tail adaptor